MPPAQACPVCDAALDRPRQACWLCRHPIPERALPPPAPADVPLVGVPPPPLCIAEVQADDGAELDRTSLTIALGLLAATLGAFGFQRGFGWLMGTAVVLPLAWLVFDFIGRPSPQAPAEPEPTLARQILRGTAAAALAIVAVAVALVIALFLACTSLVFGLSVFGTFFN